MINGVVIGTGSKITVSGEKCGFRPSRVELSNKAGLATAHWTDTMIEGHMVKFVDSGEGAVDQVDITDAAKGIKPLASGFEIGTDADINASGEAIHFTAYP